MNSSEGIGGVGSTPVFWCCIADPRTSLWRLEGRLGHHHRSVNCVVQGGRLPSSFHQMVCSVGSV